MGNAERSASTALNATSWSSCGEPYTPNPNERKRTINAVLTAVRGEFGVTEGMEPCFTTRCYRAAGGQCVHPFGVEISEPTVEVIRPIDGTEVTGKAAAAAAFALQIENSRARTGQRVWARPWLGLQRVSGGAHRSAATGRYEGSCLLETVVLAALRPDREVRGAMPAASPVGE